MRGAPDAVDAPSRAVREPRRHRYHAARRAGALKPAFQAPDHRRNPDGGRETHRDIAQRRREKSHRQEAPDVGVIGEETVGELAERIGVEQRRADRAEFDGSEDTLIDQWLLDYAERETTGIDEIGRAHV